MTVKNGYRLSPYYLNTRRLSDISGQSIPVVAQTSLIHNSGERSQAMAHANIIANELILSGHFTELTRAFVTPETESNSVIASIWAVFTFKGVANALERERQIKSAKSATFSATIPLGDTEYTLTGELSNEHLYSTTSQRVLSNKRRLLMVGRFQFNGNQIELMPYIIGDLIESAENALNMSWAHSVRIYPEMIDNFEKMNNIGLSTKAEHELLLATPEENVKHAFAKILGEPFVPKDWGGEKSDLQTSRLKVQQNHISAAFIFKGLSVKGEMHPANMGKRGDQIVRAFDEPVDLVVVQHCNKIANSVVRVAEALAFYPPNLRRYCIIDGEDTIRILKAYNMFPPPAI